MKANKISIKSFIGDDQNKTITISGPEHTGKRGMCIEILNKLEYDTVLVLCDTEERKYKWCSYFHLGLFCHVVDPEILIWHFLEKINEKSETNKLVVIVDHVNAFSELDHEGGSHYQCYPLIILTDETVNYVDSSLEAAVKDSTDPISAELAKTFPNDHVFFRKVIGKKTEKIPDRVEFIIAQEKILPHFPKLLKQYIFDHQYPVWVANSSEQLPEKFSSKKTSIWRKVKTIKQERDKYPVILVQDDDDLDEIDPTIYTPTETYHPLIMKLDEDEEEIRKQRILSKLSVCFSSVDGQGAFQAKTEWVREFPNLDLVTHIFYYLQSQQQE